MNKKILIVQTAFIGDVILATSLVEFIAKEFPNAHIDFFLRHGNQTIMETNPNVKKVWIWDKSKSKFFGLIKLIFAVRKEKYDYVFNVQRFFNSGLLTTLSGAKKTIGFHSNPLSTFFTKKIIHKIPHKENGVFLHEVQRNCQLIRGLFPEIKIPSPTKLKTKLYFNDKDQDVIKDLALPEKYFVIAPSSVWYTKQWHVSKWEALIKELTAHGTIYLIGAPSDNEYVSKLILNKNVINLCGQLSLRQSALLMKTAKRVFVNDSAPLHLASSVNANTTAIFCSTVPDFGYFPLSDNSELIQVEPRLECMPCGLHGHKECPKSHFKCAMDVDVTKVLNSITKSL
ncbi:MAG: heptosyltransferase-2 [Bacteriovoracaceae bacterium]|jgi:ADP-heptose:LPS heptosyltransferase